MPGLRDFLIRGAVEIDSEEAEGALAGLIDRMTGPAGIAATAAAAAGAFAAFAAQTLAAADEIDALSVRTGLSAEDLQRWGEVASRSGGDIEDVADAAREMQLRLAEAAALGSGPAVDALRLLGLTLEDIPLEDAGASFGLLRQRISEVEDPAQRLFAAEELLGGSVERLNGLLGAQQHELDAVSVLTEEQVAAANDAADAWAAASHELTVAAQAIVVDLAPALTTMAQAAVPAAEVLGGLVGAADESTSGWARLGQAARGVIAPLSFVTDVIRGTTDDTDELARSSQRVPRALGAMRAEADAAAAATSHVGAAHRMAADDIDAYVAALARASAEMSVAQQRAATLTAHLSELIGAQAAADLGSLGGDLRDLTRTGGGPSATARQQRQLREAQRRVDERVTDVLG